MDENHYLVHRKATKLANRQRKLERVTSRINDLDNTIPTLGSLTGVFGGLAAVALLAGFWLVGGILGLMGVGTGVAHVSMKRRLRALEAEETYLIEAGEIEDDL